MASVVLVAFGRRILSALRHGPAGTIAGLATVPGEGQDVSQAWTGPTTACHPRQPEAAKSNYNKEPATVCKTRQAVAGSLSLS
ncbi:hypothetical protein ACFP1L_10215 [Lactiplantibacillus nangangensis]|uniref:Uncharacterized protein n=1 Tax=Lactiplantibacillus nangangensis TaxID=2559917 RepID=A0ABW1SLH5_9LACO|nr:hypothetical protein [Lactiplantibacillus nangangensis]